MIEASLLGKNVNRIKAHNLRAVLWHLLYNEPAYRVQIAEQLSLSTTTITNMVDELIQMGLVAESGVEEIDGPRRVGRPRAALRLVKDARYAIGVQIGVEFYRIAISNLKAEILRNYSGVFHREAPAEEVLHEIANQVEHLVAGSGLERQRIVGVGVGAAGLVNYRTGVNLVSTNLGWENVPIRQLLEARLGLPVVVDNNVKAMALGEGFFGVGREVNSLVFVYGRAGVGSGIIMDNHLLRGADLGAGEIGHMIVIADGGKPCRCGQHGCLETLVSEGALLGEAEALARRQPDGILARLLSCGEGRPVDRIFQAARQGDPLALEMMERAARYVGIALANLVNLLNPQMILLGGLFAQGQDLLLPTAQQTLINTAFAGLGRKVRLQATCFGWQAGMVGAAALALISLFYSNPEENE